MIIGAGPSGLTAGYELLSTTDIRPIIIEMTNDIGGFSKTINYKGNRIDLGGHRFFSKSEKVMNWWIKMLPLQGFPSKDDIILNRDSCFLKEKDTPDPEKIDKVMLIRQRLSRIYFLKKFFDYPVSASFDTLKKLGFVRIIMIVISYLMIKLFPIKDEKSLEDFFINRFGKELYLTFFKEYTQKVWGVPCNKISAEWGEKRVRGLSIYSAFRDVLKNLHKKDKSISQKNIETTLIRQFIYPKLGPGQLWEEIAASIENKGGIILKNHTVVGVKRDGKRIESLEIVDNQTHAIQSIKADYIISTMPITELINAITPKVPDPVVQVSNGLIYRDFITVGILAKKLKVTNQSSIKTINNIIPDNWIYIQERNVKMGRIQIFNNWSPYMVKDQNTVWFGLEYFCTEGDELWQKPDSEFRDFAIAELIEIDFVEKNDILDSTVIKMKKAYPCYFGSYNQFDTIKEYLDQFANLYVVGRCGMFKYDSTDYYVLTSMKIVENIKNNSDDKESLWNVVTHGEFESEN